MKTYDEVRILALRDQSKLRLDNKGYADFLDCSYSSLNQFFRGRNAIPIQLQEHLGFDKQTVFVRK